MNPVRKGIWLFCAIVILVVFGVYRAGGQSPAPASDPFGEADEKNLAEIHDHSEAMANLEYLSDIIGSRLTGYERTKKANEWTAEVFRKYGLTNVHLEPWTIAHSWTRGTAHARVLSPSAHPLTIASAGWSPSTPGVVRGPVIYFNPRSEEDFAEFKGKLKGAIIISAEPQSLSPPPPAPQSPMLFAMQAPPPLPGQPAPPSPFARLQELNRKRNQFMKEEGVAAVFLDSGKPHALLNMTGIGGGQIQPCRNPPALIPRERYPPRLPLPQPTPPLWRPGINHYFHGTP